MSARYSFYGGSCRGEKHVLLFEDTDTEDWECQSGRMTPIAR
jgi:hypothetical protein